MRREVGFHGYILAAPGKPKGPLKVKDVTAKGLKLAWEKPEDDGGAPITGKSWLQFIHFQMVFFNCLSQGCNNHLICESAREEGFPN